MIFNSVNALLFWIVLFLPPATVSIVYLFSLPTDVILTDRLAVSAHGFVISILCYSTLIIGTVNPRQEFLAAFTGVCWLPIVLILYSFWKFQGNKYIHLLQVVNIAYWFLLIIFGGMAITGVWV